mmetsp:Transcript_8858/g.26187  ORF Transcript_8858/g.26187 Transcript_8858/m.26187 type:complete len:219 (+) Transcript_8858:49-705(+)
MNARRLVTQSNMTARNRIDEYTTDRVLLMPCQYRILVNTEAPRRRKIIALRLIEIVNARINRFAVSGHLLGRHHAARATGAREAERESALTDAMPEPATGAPGGSFESASTIADAGNAGPPASLSMYSFSCAISCCIFIIFTKLELLNTPCCDMSPANAACRLSATRLASLARVSVSCTRSSPLTESSASLSRANSAAPASAPAARFSACSARWAAFA